MITPLTCEIHAPSKTKIDELCRIVKKCCEETAQPINTLRHQIPRNQRRSTPTTLTLHLPVAAASTQHPAWCLACRITCFCPEVRVSVLVLGADAFRTPAKPTRETDKPSPDLLALWA